MDLWKKNENHFIHHNHQTVCAGLRKRAMENRTVLVVTLFAVGLTCASCFGPVRGLGALLLPQEPSLTQRKQHVRCPSASCARFLMLSGRERDKDAIIDIDATEVNPYVQTPVTLLGGFLGAGKTTVLKTMIENSEGIRVGIIVNDVAEVNIDAMLIRKTSDGDVSAVADTTVELQNGCACCSIRDELFDSVRQVLELGVSRGEPFDRIVIELSGVAEPAVVKRNILRAQKGGRFAEVARAMDLRTVVTVVDASTFVDTWMSQNTMGASPLLWEGEQAQQDPCVQARPLSEFLAEQVEAADKIILNKVDLVDDRTKSTALEIIGGVMNSGKFYRQNKFSVSDEQGMKIDVDPLSVCTAVRGKVPLEFLLPERSTMKRGGGSDAANGRTGADMREEGHAGRGAKTNAEKEFGIRSIVYEARRPFSRSRLFTLFTSWPTLSLDGEIGEFLKDVILSDAARDAFKANPEAPPPTSGASLLNVVRSKGFCWVEDQANLCYYWSHAGRCFAVTSIGQWWADTSPADLESAMRENPKVMKGMLQQEWQGEVPIQL